HMNSVTIEGEPALKHKDFGSNFFNVGEGLSELLIYPEGVFDTKVLWQDRWL
ncbi:TPA: phage tail protein, partial [Staphylococcus aureus]|nr:phage tail protein [Staphylococcus aureus]HDS2168741.1 phage tail protein [Staphylococcus aureus]HDS2168757.1 phage tail protein [Staphylococcus aureus]